MLDLRFLLLVSLSQLNLKEVDVLLHVLYFIVKGRDFQMELSDPEVHLRILRFEGIQFFPQFFIFRVYVDNFFL